MKSLSSVGDIIFIRSCRTVYYEHRIVWIFFLFAAIYSSYPVSGESVIFEILYTPLRIAGENEIDLVRFRLAVMRCKLTERFCLFAEFAPVILHDYIAVIIVSAYIAVNTAGYHEHGGTVFRSSEYRTDAGTVNAAAGKFMLGSVRHDSTVHSRDLGKIDGLHYTVGFGIHIRACNLIYIKYGNIECIFVGYFTSGILHDALTYCIMLELKRSINPPVLIIEIDTPEMTRKSAYPTDCFPIESCLYEYCCKGIVNIFVCRINGDALKVSCFPQSGIYASRELVNIEIFHFPHSYIFSKSSTERVNITAPPIVTFSSTE